MNIVNLGTIALIIDDYLEQQRPGGVAPGRQYRGRLSMPRPAVGRNLKPKVSPGRSRLCEHIGAYYKLSWTVFILFTSNLCVEKVSVNNERHLESAHTTEQFPTADAVLASYKLVEPPNIFSAFQTQHPVYINIFKNLGNVWKSLCHLLTRQRGLGFM